MRKTKSGPKRPEYEPNTVEERLGYLVEECAEVLHAAGKSLRFGLDAVNPELPVSKQERNRDWLRREIADLKVAMKKIEGVLKSKTLHLGASRRTSCLPFCELKSPHTGSPCMNFDPSSRVDEHAVLWVEHEFKKGNRRHGR